MSSPAATAYRPESRPTACFSVHASAEPGVMPRVVELFAKRGLVPASWISRVSGSELTIDLQMPGLDAETAHYIARCLRQIISVDVVLVSQKQ
jgi:acetolactate synthase small subunit